MKKTKLIVFLFLLLCNFLNLNGQIIGGQLAGANPGYVVSLHNETFGFVGAGVILDAKTILTAAHVVDIYAPQCGHCLNINAGGETIGASIQTTESTEIILHPDFVEIPPLPIDPVGFDLAIIKLSDELIFNSNVKPIEITRSCIFDDNDFSFGTGTTIYGWGATSITTSTTNSTSLRMTNQSIFDLSGSQFWIDEPFYEDHYDNASMFASYSSQSQTYFGDSGGPCVVENNGIEYLAGIVSWGRDPNLSNDPNILYPGVMADVYKMRAWILENLKEGGYSCSMEGPVLDNNSINISCSETSVDLSVLIAEDIPPGLEIKWSTDDDPLDCVSPVFTDFVSADGTYYAYFYDMAKDCYSLPSESVSVSLGCTSENNLLATSDMTLGTNQTYNKIEIRDGATLTVASNTTIRITDRILVGPGSKILIDGGILTNCPSCPKWQGITIEGIDNTGPGFSMGGEVEIRNGGIIEYANIGVEKLNTVTGNGPGGLQYVTHTNVGKLTMSPSATIRNCTVGVELNSTGGSSFGVSGLESSTINGAFFDDNRIGIRLKGNRGLAINESTFNSHSNIGVEIINSFVDITNNNFISHEISVFINAPYPSLMGSNISGNSFVGESIAAFSVYNESLNNAEYLNIRGNTMLSYDIYNLGLSTFLISNNDLLFGYHAITSSATGLNVDNIVQDNTFSNNNVGNNVDGMNDIEYLTNCFEVTTGADIGLGYGATIDDEQGDDDDSAGNCFDDGSRIETVESFDSTTAFKYYTKDGTNNLPWNCKGPGSGNFEIIVAQFESENIHCGSGTPIFGDLPEAYRDCEQFYNDHKDQDLSDFIDALEDEIIYIQQLVLDGALNNWVAQRLLAMYRSCIDKAMKTKIIKILEESDDVDREEAIAFLTSSPYFRYQIMAYGLMVDKEEYSRARALLDGLNSVRDDEYDFVSVQQVYLDYLEARDTYVLAPGDRDMIYNVGEKRLPLSGFARTVYYSLTGDRHFITVPAYDGAPHSRVVKQDVDKHMVRVYPNPSLADEALRIYIDGNEEKEDTYALEIYNSEGELILEDLLSMGGNEVKIDATYKGLLFVRIKNRDKIIYADKLLRL